MRKLTMALWVALGLVAARPVDAQVRVFVLAGQSNMEGKAQNKLWDFQATDDKTKAFFAHMRKGDKWVVRDDVFIKFLGRHGKLTLGYGSRGRTGCEFEFGLVMGEHFKEPVLLIKTAWGGRAIGKTFRPPSAGLPSKEALATELERRIKNTKNRNERRKKQAEARGRPPRLDAYPTMEELKAEFGRDYRAMIAEVRAVLDKPDKFFPSLKGKKLELSGFVWFQGWNDQYNGLEKEYASNLKHLIADVRKDLGVAKLPVVIGAMGQHGSKPVKGAMKTVQDAQLSMNSVPEFKGNVRTIRTDVLVDKAAEELYPGWRKHMSKWEKVGSDHPYHYLGSAIWFTRIGRGFAKTMLELLGESEK